jgi:hypothetical protein
MDLVNSLVISQKAVSIRFLCIEIKIFQVLMVRTPGLSLSRSMQANTIIIKHFFHAVIAISRISQYLAALGKVQRQLFETIRVMRAAGGKSIFNRNTIGSNDNMYFEAVKVTPFGNTITPTDLVFKYSVTRNANIMANGYRKIVNSVCMAYAQRFNCFSGVQEKFGKQFSCSMHPAIKPTFTQHVWHQSGGTDKTEGIFHVLSKIHGGYQDNCCYPGVVYFTVYGLFRAHRFQYIIKIIATVFIIMVNPSLFGLNTTKVAD